MDVQITQGKRLKKQCLHDKGDWQTGFSFSLQLMQHLFTNAGDMCAVGGARAPPEGAFFLQILRYWRRLRSLAFARFAKIIR